MRGIPIKPFYAQKVPRNLTPFLQRPAVLPLRYSRQKDRTVAAKLAVSFLALSARFNQLKEFETTRRIMTLFPGLEHRSSWTFEGQTKVQAILDRIRHQTDAWLKRVTGDNPVPIFENLIDDCAAIETQYPITHPHYCSLLSDESGQFCLLLGKA